MNFSNLVHLIVLAMALCSVRASAQHGNSGDRTGRLVFETADGTEFAVGHCAFDDRGAASKCVLEPGYTFDDFVNFYILAAQASEQREEKCVDTSKDIVDRAKRLAKDAELALDLADAYHKQYDGCVVAAKKAIASMAGPCVDATFCGKDVPKGK